ncbi:MAG: NADH:flavin oxidoreductase [Dehalococcoidales bacterium]|nr:NADH:flavin oxidoreductase [Dehalococcoidales bacterium]
MKLFQPITIHGMKVPNRIVYPATQLNMGLNNRRARAFYGERARGGAGLIITAATAIDNFACEELWGGEEGLEAFINRAHALTDEIHQIGAKIGVQLWQGHRFPQGKGQQTAGVEVNPDSGDPISPSAEEGMRALTIPEIESIIYRFAKAARNVRKAGFDCVELHGAHRYLLCKFTNPELNHRTDKYGGSPAGRMKFGLDTVKAVRTFIGPDFPLIFRLGALELNGEIHPESITYAQELEKAGVDCIDVSSGGWGKYPVSPTKRKPMGTFTYLSEPIKKKVNIPVIAVGRINTPEVAEQILANKQADLVAICRQLICDPFWPKKVRENRFNEVVTCESCNVNCFASTFKRRLPKNAPMCKHNERVGKEWEIPATEQ